MPSWISSALAATAYGLRFIADLFDDENTADVVKAKKAALKQARLDQINADAAKGDLDAERKDVSP